LELTLEIGGHNQNLVFLLHESQEDYVGGAIDIGVDFY